MKFLPIVMLFLVGCSGRGWIGETAKEVDDVAFAGQLNIPTQWDNSVQMKIVAGELHWHQAWVWEPKVYLIGTIAHVMIHAKFGNERHDAVFMAERQRVADALGINVGYIPIENEYSKIEVTRDMKIMSYSYSGFVDSTRMPLPIYDFYLNIPNIRP